MKLSIVTPVLNDPRVTRALDSVLSQALDCEMELVVIDGGSTDGTLAALAAYRDRIGVLVSERDRGIYDAMNKGVQRASGDVIGILNADDEYADAHVLQDVMKAFADSRTAVAYGDLVYVDAGGQVVRYWRSGPFRPRRFYLGWMPPHPTFFVRREVYQQYGVFDLQYRIASDYELVLRFMMKYRLTSAYISRVLVRMTLGGDSNRSWKNIVRANREVYWAWRNNGLALGYLVPLLKPASKLLQFVRRPPVHPAHALRDSRSRAR